MNIILMGCEYVGKRTLAKEAARWWQENTGQSVRWHDHFTPPFQVQDNPTTNTEKENEQVANLIPSLQEKFQRYVISYHIGSAFANEDVWAINLHYGDAVYAPMYYGYGAQGQFGDRELLARWWDHEMLVYNPAWILVLMKASPEVVLERMRRQPRPKSPIKEADIERILFRFEAEFDRSLIKRKFALDTSQSTPQQTFEEFVQRINPLLTDSDRLHILSHKLMKP